MKKQMLLFYNELTQQSLDELPDHARTILRKLSKNELCKPLVIKDRSLGMTLGQLSLKYDLTRSQIQYLLKTV